MDDFEKLINASDLIEWIMETYPDWCVGDVRSIVDHVKDLPSAHPEIIRCKDCKHRPKEVEGSRYLVFPDNDCICQCDDPWDEWMPNDDFYCAHGERRVEDETD